MGKGQGWFGLRRESSGGKTAAPQFPDDPSDEQLCGVGVVLYKAPDNSLFVKVRTPVRSLPRRAPAFATPAEPCVHQRVASDSEDCPSRLCMAQGAVDLNVC